MNESVSGKKSIEDINQFIQETLLTLEPACGPILSDGVQEELSKSITLLQRVKRCLIISRYRKNQARQEQLEAIAFGLTLAIVSLLQNPHTFLFARRLRRDAEFVVREFNNPIIGRLINGFKYVLYESNTPVKVLFGLCLALPVYLTVPGLPYQRIVVQPLLEPILAENQTIVSNQNSPASTSQIAKPLSVTRHEINTTIALLVLVGVAGSLGSIVSILTRIKEYENEKYTDTILPVLIGAFKPLIGGAFGIFLFALISSGLLPLQIKDDVGLINEWYALFALAFVAGFSERLVKDIISQTENKVLPASETLPTLSQPVTPPTIPLEPHLNK